MKEPYLADFEEGTSLALMPAPNGGWIVRDLADRGYQDRTLGAFGNARDMLSALAARLDPAEDRIVDVVVRNVAERTQDRVMSSAPRDFYDDDQPAKAMDGPADPVRTAP